MTGFHRGAASRRAGCLAACVSALVPGAIAAQEQAGQSSIGIQEVVVTARKVEESIQDTPVAVSAFSNNDLKVRGALDVTDVAKASPNVTIDSGASFSGSSATPVVFIRGIGQQDFVITSDPAVGVYLDGVYIARTVGSLLDLVDIERVEVLRGPQGTLFGRNSIGGAVSVISKKPEPGFSGSVEATAGEDDWYEGRAILNVPISDTLLTRVSAMGRTRDGFVDAVNYDSFKLGGRELWGVRGQARWLPSDDITFDVSVDYQQDRSGPAPWRTVSFGNGSLPNGTGVFANFFNAATGDPTCLTDAGVRNNPTCAGPVHLLSDKFESNSLWVDLEGNQVEPEQELDVVGVSFDFKWALPFGDFQSITAYRAFDATFNNDLDGLPLLVFHNINENFDNEQMSQELQLTGSSFAGRLDWVTGLYLFHEEGEENVTILAAGIPPGVPNPFPRAPRFLGDSRKINNNSYAAFAQGTLHLFDDRLHVTGGLRFTKDEKTFTFQQDVGGNFGRRVSGFQEVDKLNPLISGAFDITDNIMVYVSYSEGFRDGGFPARATGVTDTILSFDPEEVSVIEGGVKSSWLDERVRMNLAVFNTDYTDYQVSATDPNAPPELRASGVSNIPSVTIQGVEVEASALVTESLRLDLTLGYLDDEIDDTGGELFSGNLPPSPVAFPLTTDSSLPFTPEWTWDLGASYSHFLPNGGELLLRGDWIYTDEQFFGIENLPEQFQDAYSQVNASLTYRHPGDRWEAVLGATNLTDEVWSTTAIFSLPGSSFTRTVSRPRTVYGTVRFYFGD